MSNTLKLGTDGNWATKDGSLLGYNSENGNYKPLPFNFERASGATRVNKDGLIEVVSNNKPRIDFKDSADGSLLLEPARTNLLTYSEAFDNAAWDKSGSSVTSDFVSPKGDLSAFKLVEDTSTAAHMLQTSSYSFVSTNSYSFSVRAKSLNRGLQINMGGGINVACFNCLTGEVTFEGVDNIYFTNMTAKTRTMADGWFEFSASFDCILSVASKVRLVMLPTPTTITNNPSYTGDGTSGIYIWGAQLEQGSYATSYIPTQGSVVTRDADICSQTTPSGIIGQTEGTMFFEINFANTSGVAGAWSISDGSSANRITMNTTNFSSTQFSLSIAQNYNSSSTKLASTNVTYSDNHKVAIKYSATTLKLFVDGQLVDSVSTDGFGNYTKFYIGGNQVGAGGDARKFIQATLYNTALTDKELQELTS